MSALLSFISILSTSTWLFHHFYCVVIRLSQMQESRPWHDCRDGELPMGSFRQGGTGTTVETGSYRWEVSGRRGATDGKFSADRELPMGSFRQGGTGTTVQTGSYRWEVSDREVLAGSHCWAITAREVLEDSHCWAIIAGEVLEDSHW